MLVPDIGAYILDEETSTRVRQRKESVGREGGTVTVEKFHLLKCCMFSFEG
jgi:hypothetical protein